MKKSLILVILLAFTACGTSGVDQSKPENVIQALFDAAQTETYDNLSSLCHASVDADADSTGICNLPDSDKPIFVEVFSTAKVTGDAKIDGDTAEVPVNIQGEDDFVELKKVEDKWYLADM
ncbi:hypothetical protein ACFL21_04950 [Patescibacteria group bacterium]